MVKSTMTKTCSAVLRSRRNCSSDGAERTDDGRAFHARAAVTGKARSPSVVRRVDGMTSVDVCVYIARMEQLETAFHSSEFYQLVVEATEDSLNRALDLFDAPRGVDVSLTGRPSAQSYDEVGAVLLDAGLIRPILVRLNSKRECLQCSDAVGWAAGRASGR